MISAEDFINELFGELPNFFSSREELHTLWSQPDTREKLLKKMEQAGYGKEVLKNIRKIIDAENCDLLDVLEYVAYNTTPIERSRRAEQLKGYMDIPHQAIPVKVYIPQDKEELFPLQVFQHALLEFQDDPSLDTATEFHLLYQVSHG